MAVTVAMAAAAMGVFLVLLTVDTRVGMRVVLPAG
jgi:hypothetical protein